MIKWHVLKKKLWPMKLFDVMPWFVLKICLDELVLHLKVVIGYGSGHMWG
jgi:hypothetical protein